MPSAFSGDAGLVFSASCRAKTEGALSVEEKRSFYIMKLVTLQDLMWILWGFRNCLPQQT